MMMRCAMSSTKRRKFRSTGRVVPGSVFVGVSSLGQYFEWKVTNVSSSGLTFEGSKAQTALTCRKCGYRFRIEDYNKFQRLPKKEQQRKYETCIKCGRYKTFVEKAITDPLDKAMSKMGAL
jgi:hypothetical protein